MKDAVDRYREMVEDHEAAEEELRKKREGDGVKDAGHRVLRHMQDHYRELDAAAQAAWEQLRVGMEQKQQRELLAGAKLFK
jgi:hypothetical protein